MKQGIGLGRVLARISLTIAGVVMPASALLMAGCGGHSTAGSSTGSSGFGTAAVFLSSVPSTTVAAVTVDIESAALTSEGSANTALTTGAGAYELNHLALTPTLVADSRIVPLGAYQGLSFTFANPQLQVVDDLGNVTLLTPSTTPSVQVTSGSVTLVDAITVAGGTGSAIAVTLDLSKSLSVDSQGNYTLTPAMSVANASSSGPQMIAAPAQIATVAAYGLAEVQFAESGQTLGLALNPATDFSGAATAASGLNVGQMVNISASLLSSGTMLATMVDSQPAAATVEQRGVVAGVGNDSSGNLVIYTMLQ
jgi:hypothetical protein